MESDHTGAHSLAVRKTEIMKMAGKWIDLESILLTTATGSERKTSNVFSHMWSPAYNVHKPVSKCTEG